MQYVRRLRQKQADASWKHIQSVLSMIGDITIKWASVELFLNHLIAWHHATSGKSLEKELPLMLSRKLIYLKKMENSGQFAADQVEHFQRFRLEMDRLSELRHHIIHGVVHQRNRYTMVWHTHSLKFHKHRVEIVEATYTHAHLLQHLKDIGALAHEMSPYFARIVGIPHPANSE